MRNGVRLGRRVSYAEAECDRLLSMLGAHVEVHLPDGDRDRWLFPFASGLIASGCDVVTVQRALGHASATTTPNSYSHLWPDADDRTRAATESLMAASLDSPADHLRTR
jgi:integrase